MSAPVIEIADHPGYRFGHRVLNPTPAEKLACQRARRALRELLIDRAIDDLEARLKALPVAFSPPREAGRGEAERPVAPATIHTPNGA